MYNKKKIIRKLKKYVKYHWNGTLVSDIPDENSQWYFRCDKGHEFKRSLKDIHDKKFCDTCTPETTNIIHGSALIFESVLNILVPFINKLINK